MSSDDFSPLEDLDMGATVRGLRAGQKLLKRYTLKRILGRGGMGVVWLAYDESLEREIAFKFLPETVTHDRSAVDEIKRETRQSLELTHPHIVRIYDFVHDEQCAGLSMEYIDGDTLSNLRADQPNRCFDVGDLDLWIRQLCSALESAHEDAELAHRDLKPANLMIDKRGRLKIADFGISRSVSNTLARVTMQTGVSGTLVYMSPQQAMGEPASILDDIYSLGATLYELLTSKPPFYQGEIMAQVREKVPPAMAQRRKDLGISGKAIPRRWEDTVAACLSKDAAQRPQSCREVMQSLGVSDTKRLPRPKPKASEGKKPRTPRAKPAQPGTEAPSEPSEPSTPATVDYDLAVTAKFKPKTTPPKSEPEKADTTPAALDYDLAVTAKFIAKTPPPKTNPEKADTAPAALDYDLEAETSEFRAKTQPPKSEPQKPPVPVVPLPAVAAPPPTPSPPMRPPATLPTPVQAAEAPVKHSQRLTHLVILLLLLVAAGWYYNTRPQDEAEQAVVTVKWTDEELKAAQRAFEQVKAAKAALAESVAKGEQLAAELKKRDQDEAKRKAEAEKAALAADSKTKSLADTAEKARLKADQEKTGETEKAKRAAAAELKAQQEANDKRMAIFEEEKKAAAKEKAEMVVLLEKQKMEAKRLKEEAMETERIANLRGGVVVKTIPEEARVTLGSKSLAGKSVLFAGLREGEHPVEIQLDGYETTNLVAVVQDNPKTKVASTNVYPVTLTRSTGTLQLASTPDKTRYTLTLTGPQKLIGPQNAPRSGQTPAVVKLPTGTYKLELKKDHWVVNREFTILRDQAIDLALDMPFGSLRLESEPPGATVFHKGNSLGVTPLERPEFELGDAEFELRKNLYRPVTTNLTIKAQQLAGLKVKLALRLGPGYRQMWTNSLGMKFIPLGDGKKLMCVWETRKRDFDAFSKQGPPEHEFEPKPTSGHPVVNVSWQEARAFCDWLTKKEQSATEPSATRLEKQSYRLPTDAEWSEAAGLKNEPGATLAERHVARRGEYPWGNTFPPPVGAGNYDQEFFCDRYDFTAIVGSFKANNAGLFDIAGNVWEWCDDWFDGQKTERVARGGSWSSIGHTSTARDLSADVLLSSYRLHLAPEARKHDVGFRCVLEIGVLE